ncbi:GspH/FimT family pseudopilin [Pseudomonas sp. LjRoot71]|uniref:GspH/FimT family pseudopilin n=1 Tax=Pseudomonas sp. LjRoot71 TaxID=3342336 RepID=UPI003ECDBF1A
MLRSKGFTLIELMITVAILGVILGLAVPAMGDFAVRQRVSGQASELMLALAFARSEAVKQNREIAVLPATNAATGWADGWCVGPATGADAMDNCTSNNRLRNFQAKSGVTVNSNFLQASNKLVFQRDGTCSLCGSTPFKISSTKLKATPTDARCIDINRQGRPTLRKVSRDTACN